MSFAIQLDQNQSLINAKLMGEITPEIALEFFQELLHKVKTSGVNRIFSDATEMELTRPLEQFIDLPKKLQVMGFPSDLKRAILVSEELENFKLWENILFSRGYQQVKLFWTEKEAREWLMSS